MPETIDYALFATRVYDASDDNKTGIPAGWTELVWQPDYNLSGFSAGAYRNGNEVVIAYTGTNEGVDWMSNGLAGTGLLPAPQIFDAMRFYLDVKAANPDATSFTFTGHSLGGGLASLMAVFFDKQATVFDEAPFQVAAVNPLVTEAVAAYMIGKGYEDSTFSDYVSSAGALALTRESNVTNYYVEGEALDYPRFSFDTLVGQEYMFSMGGSTAAPVDLHSMSLMTALQYSNAFRDAVKKLPDLVTLLLDNNLYATDASNPSEDLLRRLLRHELGITDAIQPDGMLDRFASDMNKLAQEGGLTMQDGSGPYISAMNDVATSLEEAKGYTQYFQNYLSNGLVFSAAERGLIQPALPDARDWYVQAGSGGMNVGDSQNRGAFLLGGEGDDALTGGTGNDLLVGNVGADTLSGAAGEDVLIGGKDYDTYHADGGDGSGDTILDVDGKGEVWFNDTKLGFATRKKGETVYHDKTGISYELRGRDLVIDDALVIKDFHNEKKDIFNGDGMQAAANDTNCGNSFAREAA